jgi:ABC-type nitrate/sulfonate/bicarbonate transport system substrate-binding protein
MNIPLKSRFLKFVVLALALAACTSTPFGQAPTNEPMTLRVNVFRGASNLPIYMAIENGYYTRLGITPVLEFTPNSIAQRTGLAEGKFEIAHAAVDNAVAMIETAKADVVIVAGGDGGLNEFLVRKEINQAEHSQSMRLIPLMHFLGERF